MMPPRKGNRESRTYHTQVKAREGALRIWNSASKNSPAQGERNAVKADDGTREISSGWRFENSINAGISPNDEIRGNAA